ALIDGSGDDQSFFCAIFSDMDKYLFVTMFSGWGGSEELWSRSALALLGGGFPPSARVRHTKPLHPRLRELRTRGVELLTRPVWYSWRQDFMRWLLSWRAGTTAHVI